MELLSPDSEKKKKEWTDSQVSQVSLTLQMLCKEKRGGI